MTILAVIIGLVAALAATFRLFFANKVELYEQLYWAMAYDRKAVGKLSNWFMLSLVIVGLGVMAAERWL